MSKSTSRAAAMSTGVNRLSTDGKAAKAVVSADVGSTSGLRSYDGASFQDYVDHMQWKNDLGCIGLLNVRVGVDLLNPTKKTHHDTLTTGTDTKKTLPTSANNIMLDWWKLYLDISAIYHTAFVDWYLENVQEVDIVLNVNCNAGLTTSN